MVKQKKQSPPKCAAVKSNKNSQVLEATEGDTGQMQVDSFFTPNYREKKRKIISPLDGSTNATETRNEMLEAAAESELKETDSDLLNYKEKDQCKLTNRIEILETAMSDMMKSLEFQTQECDDLKRENREINEKNQLLEGRLTRAEKVVEDMREKVLEVQSRQMQDNLILYNIHEQDGVENTEALLLDFFQGAMKISDEQLAKVEIDRCHRLGVKHATKSRPIVVKLASSKSKAIILKHARNLAGSKYSINDQQPREYDERRKMLLPLFKQARKDKVPARWSKDKLVINNNMIQAPKDKVMDINIDVMSRASELRVKRAPPVTHNASTFQGTQVNVTSTDDIIPAIHAILKDTRTGRATHNIYSYRIKVGDKFIEHYDDDGEYGAGRRLLSHLQNNNVQNELICVSRWHMGGNLGIARFDHIRDAADAVMKM